MPDTRTRPVGIERRSELQLQLIEGVSRDGHFLSPSSALVHPASVSKPTEVDSTEPPELDRATSGTRR